MTAKPDAHCSDSAWTGQNNRHLAGRLGALLCAALLDAGWITRAPAHRAIRLTEEGRHQLHTRLGLTDSAK
jgi:hypothetical protein